MDGTVAVMAKPKVSDGDKLPIKMLNDRVLVQANASEGERRTSGGILIPATAQMSKRLAWAEVVAVGPGKMTEDGKRIPPEVKEGDRVLYGKYSGTDVKVGDDDYLILRESDVLAIISK